VKINSIQEPSIAGRVEARPALNVAVAGRLDQNGRRDYADSALRPGLGLGVTINAASALRLGASAAIKVAVPRHFSGLWSRIRHCRLYGRETELASEPQLLKYARERPRHRPPPPTTPPIPRVR